MCVVSMIGDHYGDKWPTQPVVYPQNPWPIQPQWTGPTQAELDEFRRLLQRAKEYDAKNNQPHCENEDKFKRLRDLHIEIGKVLDELGL